MFQKCRKYSSYSINRYFKYVGILAEVVQLEPPCTVAIVYSDERSKQRVEDMIDEIIPLGVEYKFINVNKKNKGDYKL